MIPRKRPETQKTPKVVVRPGSRRSPREPEPAAKKPRAKGPGPNRRYDSGCLWAGLASMQVPEVGSSIIRVLHQHKLGKAAWPTIQQGLQRSFVHSLASYRIAQKASPFDRRATALAWHPAHPSTLAVASKGGDIMLWNFGVKDKPTFIKGIGAGGSITGLKFNLLNTDQFYTASMEGTTTLQDFRGNTVRVFARSDCCKQPGILGTTSLLWAGTQTLISKVVFPTSQERLTCSMEALASCCVSSMTQRLLESSRSMSSTPWGTRWPQPWVTMFSSGARRKLGQRERARASEGGVGQATPGTSCARRGSCLLKGQKCPVLGWSRGTVARGTVGPGHQIFTAVHLAPKAE
ncbi:DNA damage-binding protein 2 isoform X3 [Fukomys damarensis]|uniref:DNA damage-binding protein 2 isoform X3 n=1 Tax=Fukomys damarensis TaxID=885580 RepID=UPI00053F99BF|nr:DNA damage-binding protein 2 isoform X3 [Fukomys damarensis]